MQVRVLRGTCRGREGWISGTLEDRASRGVTKALVKFADTLPELLDTVNLAPITQLSFDLPQMQKDPPPARGQRRSDGLVRIR